MNFNQVKCFQVVRSERHEKVTVKKHRSKLCIRYFCLVEFIFYDTHTHRESEKTIWMKQQRYTFNLVLVIVLKAQKILCVISFLFSQKRCSSIRVLKHKSTLEFRIKLTCAREKHVRNDLVAFFYLSQIRFVDFISCIVIKCVLHSKECWFNTCDAQPYSYKNDFSRGFNVL